MRKLTRRLVLMTCLASAIGLAQIVACSSEAPVATSPSPDATSEGSAPSDASSETSTVDVVDAGDAGVTDGAADVALSPLCSKYPNAAADASAIEGPRRLYELIALRALVAAMESCEVGTHFQDLEDPPPSLITCYGKQLASSAVADCIVAGEHIDYSKERDENFERCVPDAGAPGNSVFLGFRNPAASGYSVADVDFLLEATRKAALSTGMAPADAQRLKTLLVAQRAKVAGDAGDAGLTASTCP